MLSTLSHVAKDVTRVPMTSLRPSRYRPVIRAELSALLMPTPTPTDKRLHQSRLTPATVLTILLQLELAGLAARHPGSLVSRQYARFRGFGRSRHTSILNSVA